MKSALPEGFAESTSVEVEVTDKKEDKKEDKEEKSK